MGLTYLKMKEPKKAITQFETLAKLGNEDVLTLYYLGNAYEDLGKYDKAVVEYKKIIAKNDKSSEPYFRIADIYEKTGKIKKNVEYFEKAFERNKDNEDYYTLLAAVYLDIKEYEKAAQTYRAGIEIFPESPKLLFEIGMIYDKMKNYDKALEVFYKLLKLDPKSVEALNYIGYYYADKDIKEKLPEAEILLKKALELEPANGYYTDSLAWIYFRQEKYKEAKEKIVESIKQVKDKDKTVDMEILEHAGDISAKLGEKVQALDYYKASIKASKDKEDKQRVKGKIKGLK